MENQEDRHIKKHSGIYEILDAGIIISFQNEPLIFELDSSMTIRFSFIDTNTGNNATIKFLRTSNKELDIQIHGINDATGAGTTKPLHIGTLYKRKLYINFNVRAISGLSQKSIQYTWYLGEEVNNE